MPHTHALFLGNEFLGEVTPDDLNHYSPERLVALPYDYWSRDRRYAWVGRTPVEDPAPLQDERWALVRSMRDTAQSWGVTTPLGRVDSDPDSRAKLLGAVQMAMLSLQAGLPFSIDWTMQDNSNVPHDAQQIIQMGLLVGQHVAACHRVAIGKREAIYSAAMATAIAAISVGEGWPDAS